MDLPLLAKYKFILTQTIGQNNIRPIAKGGLGDSMTLYSSVDFQISTFDCRINTSLLLLSYISATDVPKRASVMIASSF